MNAYVMHVRFERMAEERVCLVTAWARDRRPFRVSTMGGVRSLPHDLAGFVVEQALRLPCGFFNLTAHGATFRSSGLKPTRPGRALIAAHRAELDAAEAVVHGQLAVWAEGNGGPVAAALEEADRRWRALLPGDGIELEWRRLPLPRGAGRRSA